MDDKGSFYVFHRSEEDESKLELHDMDGVSKLGFGQIRAQITQEGYVWSFPNSFAPQQAVEEQFPEILFLVVYGNEFPDHFDVWALVDSFVLGDQSECILKAIAEVENWEFERRGRSSGDSLDGTVDAWLGYE